MQVMVLCLKVGNEKFGNISIKDSSAKNSNCKLLEAVRHEEVQDATYTRLTRRGYMLIPESRRFYKALKGAHISRCQQLFLVHGCDCRHQPSACLNIVNETFVSNTRVFQHMQMFRHGLPFNMQRD
jgi:hypothetical protein